MMQVLPGRKYKAKSEPEREIRRARKTRGKSNRRAGKSKLRPVRTGRQAGISTRGLNPGIKSKTVDGLERARSAVGTGNDENGLWRAIPVRK